MIKIFLATPAYSGKVNAHYAISLAETMCLMASKGIIVHTFIPMSGSLLVAERNKIISQFMKTDCTHLLCIDADLAWQPQKVEDLLKYNLDFVGGVYPSRTEKTFTFRPSLNEDGSIKTNGINLIKVEHIPAGFMLIRRCVIEKMQEIHKDLHFKPKFYDGEEGYAFFNTEVYDGEFWGEDYVFCRRVTQAGFDMWVDPDMMFNHQGNIGSLIQMLTSEREKAMKPDEMDPSHLKKEGEECH